MVPRGLLAILVLAALMFGGPLAAQGGKAFFKEGEALRKQQRLTEAVERYTLAIQVDERMVDAYRSRAAVYQLLDMRAEAADDLLAVARIRPGSADDAAAAAAALVELDRLDEAVGLCDQALRASPKHLSALQTLVRIHLRTGDLDRAGDAADRALAAKATTDTYYLHGLARTALRDYRTAEADLERVIQWNPLYEAAYVALAEVQLRLYESYSGPTMQLRTLDKAVERVTTALELNPRNTDALITRSKALALQKEYGRAIDDISKVISLGDARPDVLQRRAGYYHGHGQHQNAINDLNRVLALQPQDIPALLLRADCKEANVDLEGAMADLEAAEKAMTLDPAYSTEERRKLTSRREAIEKKVFEMNRESDPPQIVILEPHREGDLLLVSSVLNRVKVTGYVRDRNRIASIAVNGQLADHVREDRDPEFRTMIPLGPQERTIQVEAEDIYGNKARVEVRVERTEGDPPVVALTAPDGAAHGQITVDEGQQEVFLEGSATDASTIRLVTVDGVVASFVPDTNATDFSIKLGIQDRERIVVRAEDKHGNATEVPLRIQRRVAKPAVVATPVAEKSAAKPSTPASGGITWVVFIENSDYQIGRAHV